MTLDLRFVRNQFSQFNDDPNLVFASNAGGSYVCNQVNDIFEQYNRHTRIQPYNDFAPSRNAGIAMDRARNLWAEALNIKASELTFGPSTSLNTYVMANAISANWGPGDEIVVTNQDHETNIGVWRRKAHEKGVTIREWRVNAGTGLLNIDELGDLVTKKTRWVFFTHCSNIVGTVNPVAEITAEIKNCSSARVLVDAVAYAPHHISDMQILGADAYVFSLYKVFGPHQSLLYTSNDLQAELSSQAHYFLHNDISKHLNPTGPQHAQVAACAGVIDYFHALHAHHFGKSELSSTQKVSDIHQLIQTHEIELTRPIVDYLADHKNVRLIGKPHTQDKDRAPTIAFRPLNQTSAELATTLQAANIGTEHGDFYATRLVESLGVDPSDGLVRLSLLHYNSMHDVTKILRELDIAL
jgi:selenocysteine lyase/cysteine desulfurase